MVKILHIGDGVGSVCVMEGALLVTRATVLPGGDGDLGPCAAVADGQSHGAEEGK